MSTKLAMALPLCLNDLTHCGVPQDQSASRCMTGTCWPPFHSHTLPLPLSLTCCPSAPCAGGATMTERIKESIPGTREYEATHGMSDSHRGMEQLKANIPGERPGWALLSLTLSGRASTC